MREKKQAGPPQWIDKILSKLVNPELLEEVMGDLHERFYLRSERQGSVRARRSYYREVLAYLRPTYLRRNRTNMNALSNGMMKNHLTIAWRNMIRGRVFSAINIAGLSFGISCFLLIFLWIQGEKGVNNFHQNGDRLYSVFYSEYAEGNANGGYRIPYWMVDPSFNNNIALSRDLMRSIPEIELATEYATSYELPWGYPRTFRLGDKLHKMEGGVAGEDFFKMFSYPLISGDPETALERGGIAISKTMAEVFFTRPEVAMGKSLRYENQFDLVVTAVFDDTSNNSTFQFDYLINWDYGMEKDVLFSSNDWFTVVQLGEHADPVEVGNKIRHHLKDRLTEVTEARVELGIQPFRDQYLISNFVEGKPLNGRIEYVEIFGWVAVFILLVACINFMNLTTARSVKRAKEVGVRKVIGSSRLYLVTQFLIESLVMAFLAVLLSLLAVKLLSPLIHQLTGREVGLPLIQPLFWAGLLGLTLVIGLISGFYPAIVLSSLKPWDALKGFTFKGKAALLQKGLVVFQFAISTLMLISTAVVSWQTDYIQNAHLGYDKENMISVRIEGELMKKQQYLLLKEELLKMPGIAMVDRSSEAPHSMAFEMSNPFKWQGQGSSSVGFLPTSVGYDFLKILDLDLVEGRDFNRNIASDSAAFMVNETALKEMNMSDPIGKWISAWSKKGHIVGILKDYHTHSLHEPIKPLIVDIKEDLDFGLVLIRTEPGKTKEALASMQEIFEKVNPNYPLDYQFMDQQYAALYQNEQVISDLSGSFATIAVIISCLGLFGLAIFSAEQRVKEIGIRKVLGASVTSIVSLFSRSFLQLVMISFLFAVPISYWLMDNWLADFAYRIELSWWIFAGTGFLTAMMALITIGFQAIRAAIANPVSSLRAE